MSNKFSKSALFVAAIAASLAGVSQASAEPQGTQLIQNMNRDALIANPSQLQNTTAQGVTSVSQFSDVQPTDWAFTALQSLVERYGCIAGYPDKTFRGQRATTRYEFAAGLNACLDKINELISAGLADKVGKEDLASLQKLQEEFSAELATIKGRLTAAESKITTLEAQQFSTTTKLNATAVFVGAGSFGDNAATNGIENITFSGRVRLNFDSSFSGKDLLRIRLQAGNVQNNSGSQTTRLGFDQNTNNTFTLDDFYYRFPITNQVNIVVGTSSTDVDNVLNVVNPNLASSEQGSLSRFGRRDPLVFRGQEGAGAGVQIKFNDQFSFNAAYLADSGNGNNGTVNGVTSSQAASPSQGLFGGGYSASAQIVFTPVQPLVLSFVYQRGFDPIFTVAGTTNGLSITNGTGSALANNPAGGGGLNAVLFANGASSDRFGFQSNLDLGPNLSLNGRVSYATVRGVTGGGSVDLISWLTSVTFKDLFGQGNQATLAFGQPPYILNQNTLVPPGSQNPYHLEAFYRFRLNKNISITPGLITVFNPGTGANSNVNDPIFVGVLRTSFSF